MVAFFSKRSPAPPRTRLTCCPLAPDDTAVANAAACCPDLTWSSQAPGAEGACRLVALPSQPAAEPCTWRLAASRQSCHAARHSRIRSTTLAKFGIGQAVRRVEDQRFVTGRGRYVDDITLADQCYGVAMLSPHAHARIRRVDVAAAKAA